MEEKKMPVEETSAEETSISSDVKRVVVSCHKCGAELKVKIGTELCMCPKCGEIFKIKGTVKRVKDVSPTQITKAYVKVDKDEEGNISTSTTFYH